MSNTHAIPVRLLGQSGVRLEAAGRAIYVDPYLSDLVEERGGPEMRRQVPAPLRPEEVTDAAWVLCTHIHLDHADPATLLPISRASSSASFVCPNEVKGFLVGEGLAAYRIVVAGEEWITIGEGLRIHPVPAAHPTVERDDEGFLKYVGYVIEIEGRRLYHAGDTSPDERLIEAVHSLGPIHAAFIPVNERNFYKDRRGIIGNMTVREAFQLAEELGVETLIPIHWDMFAPNSVYREEIELVYRLMQPPFVLRIILSEI